MKRFIYIVILIITLMCGCTTTDTASNQSVTINMPEDDSVNGYRLSKDQITVSQTEVTYCASVSGTKFHLSSCGNAKTINPENLYTSSSRQEFIDKGYSPCKHCEP